MYGVIIAIIMNYIQEKLPKFPSTCGLMNSMVIVETKRNTKVTFYKVMENSVLSDRSEDCDTKQNGTVSIQAPDT
jgi:hypothetical protein